MGGHGNFRDDDLGINIVHKPDLVTPKLPALSDYQLSLLTPPPPAASLIGSQKRGEAMFLQTPVPADISHRLTAT
jgi:hypothetical protein